MRADAARNAEKLRTAASTLFQQHGLNVPLKEIARVAGVSHGTLYNLFGTREALIDDVVGDLAATRLDELAKSALEFADAWDGFAYYAEQTCAIQVAEPVMADVMNGRYPNANHLMTLCHSASQTAELVIARAHQSGQLRADFTGLDLALTFGSLAHLARASSPSAPDLWRRSLQFILDGLRVEAATTSLPPVEIDEMAVYQALSALTVS